MNSLVLFCPKLPTYNLSIGGKFGEKQRIMILSAVTAGLGLAQSIYGGIKAAKAAKEQKRILGQKQAQNDAWYNKNYNQDYMDRSDAKSAFNRVKEYSDRRVKQADATAAVTGATPEQVLAQKEQANTVLAQTAGNIAQNADAYKDSVQARYDQKNDALTQSQMQQSQMSEQGGANLAAGGIGLMGSALSGMAGIKSSNIAPGADAGPAIAKLDKAYERDFK